jgi:hypothetical protein
MTTNEILKYYGINTIIIDGVKFLSKNGLLIKRPVIWNLQHVCLMAFNVVIIERLNNN